MACGPPSGLSEIRCLTQLRERISPDNRCELVDALLAAPALVGPCFEGVSKLVICGGGFYLRVNE